MNKWKWSEQKLHHWCNINPQSNQNSLANSQHKSDSERNLLASVLSHFNLIAKFGLLCHTFLLNHYFTCSLIRSWWQSAHVQSPCLVAVGGGGPVMWFFLTVEGLDECTYKQGCLREKTPLKGGKSSNHENRCPKYPEVFCWKKS